MLLDKLGTILRVASLHLNSGLDLVRLSHLRLNIFSAIQVNLALDGYSIRCSAVQVAVERLLEISHLTKILWEMTLRIFLVLMSHLTHFEVGKVTLLPSLMNVDSRLSLLPVMGGCHILLVF